MEIKIELNGELTNAKVSFAQPDDFGFVKGWNEVLGQDHNPIRNDAVDLARLAIRKYQAAFETGKYANSRRDFGDHIASNPKVEVGAFIVLKCSSYPKAEVIGFAHFRRTWCNKIVLDYLGIHPLIARPPEEPTHTVKGSGLAILYFIGRILKEQNCSALWGEATSSSASYYERVFKLPNVDDLILVQRDQVIAFLDGCEQKWLATTETTSADKLRLEEIYALETENPPFVGSNTAVFNESKRLAYRYLKLPYHKQIVIAEKLKFVNANKAPLSKENLAQIVFKTAKDTEVLADLWELVEKEHGDEPSEENPFGVSKLERL